MDSDLIKALEHLQNVGYMTVESFIAVFSLELKEYTLLGTSGYIRVHRDVLGVFVHITDVGEAFLRSLEKATV